MFEIPPEMANNEPLKMSTTDMVPSRECDSAVLFAPISSRVESGFWTSLFSHKLNVLKLDTPKLPIVGYITMPTGTGSQLSSPESGALNGGLVEFFSGSTVEGGGLLIEPPSLSASPTLPYANERIALKGSLLLLNTIEDFKRMDKNLYLSQGGNDDDEVQCLAFADLKKHTVVYWFAFPTAVPPSPYLYAPIKQTEQTIAPLTSFLESCGSASVASAAAAALDEQYAALRRRLSLGSSPKYFVIFNLVTPSLPLAILSLDEYITERSASASSTLPGDVVFGFLDPSPIPFGPSWLCRNLLNKISDNNLSEGCDVVTVLAYRPSGGLRRLSTEESSSTPSSPFSSSSLPLVNGGSFVFGAKLPPPPSPSPTPTQQPRQVVGYENNARGVPAPRSCNLGSLLSLRELSATAVDLNLSLMRWRVLPGLDLPSLRSLSALVLGSGTLGCGVARTLLAWGVRNITMYDEGRVSYSNPVRQNLFTNADCAGGGAFKAEKAAERLREIFEDVNATGVVGSIVMPGHPFGASESGREAAKAEVEKLERLIKEHDVTFLLTDTRESRWLPTLICSANNKACVNCALGLDTWLVMRHGCAPPPPSSPSNSSPPPPPPPPLLSDPVPPVDLSAQGDVKRVGCYFCNDVVAPKNSTRERTLDQQCTVTRPGLAPIASAMGVELMVGMLHRKKSNGCRGELGDVPHQIRGCLTNYSVVCPTTTAFDCCTACSWTVVDKYNQEGFDFIERVCENESYLEDLSGLTKLKEAAENMNWDCDEEDEEEGDGCDGDDGGGSTDEKDGDDF